MELSPIAEEGMHTLRACVDPGNAVEETDEEDNCAEMEFEVGNPIPDQNDLWLRALRISPDLPQADDFVTLRVQVMYTGDAQVDATTLEMRADGEIFSTCNVRSLDSRFHRSATCTSPGNVPSHQQRSGGSSSVPMRVTQVEIDEEITVSACYCVLGRAWPQTLSRTCTEEDNSYATGSFIADNFDANYARAITCIIRRRGLREVYYGPRGYFKRRFVRFSGSIDVRVIDNVEISETQDPSICWISPLMAPRQRNHTPAREEPLRHCDS